MRLLKTGHDFYPYNCTGAIGGNLAAVGRVEKDEQVLKVVPTHKSIRDRRNARAWRFFGINEREYASAMINGGTAARS